LNETNIATSWSPPNCLKPKEDDKTRCIQVKLHANIYYIYCPSGNISLQNVTYNRPLYVFTLFTALEFKINSNTFKQNNAYLGNNFDVNLSWIKNINIRILNNVFTEHVFDQISSSTSFSYPTFIFISFILIVSAIVFFYLIIIFCKKSRSGKAASLNKSDLGLWVWLIPDDQMCESKYICM